MLPDELSKIIANIETCVQNAYYIFGEEEFLKREIISAIKRNSLDAGFADFNCDELWGGDIGDGKILFDALIAIPLMIGKRLVILREAEKVSKKLQEAIPAFACSRETVFVIESSPKTKNSTFHKNLLKGRIAIECSLTSDREMADWAIFLASRKGISLDRKCADYLVSRSGVSLDAIDSELSKLEIAVKDRDVKLDDIEKITAFSASSNIFRFSDSYAERKIDEAIDISDRLFAFGESGTMILAFMKTQLFSLLRLKADPDNTEKSGIPKWKIRKVAGWARKWSIEDIYRSIISSAEADISIKTGKRTEKEAVLEAISQAIMPKQRENKYGTK